MFIMEENATLNGRKLKLDISEDKDAFSASKFLDPLCGWTSSMKARFRSPALEHLWARGLQMADMANPLQAGARGGGSGYP